MLRMYNVGEWIRNNYGPVIGKNYESRLSTIQSSYADRCLMSAQALLAGLYPPTADEIFVKGLNWRPVPVHSTPRNLDKVSKVVTYFLVFIFVCIFVCFFVFFCQQFFQSFILLYSFNMKQTNRRT